MKTAAPKGMVASSPGRGAEKLPAPGLVNLLRGKSGSRSRGRTPASRASPMFAAGRRGGTAGAEQAEPSSPKVTCIGQVRIRNKKRGSKTSKQAPPPGSAPPRRCRCRWRWRCLAVTCNPFSWKLKAVGLRRALCGKWWVLPLRSRGERKYQPRRALEREEDRRAPPPEAVVRDGVGGGSHGDDGVESDEEDGTRVFVSSATTTPPKNALLLMRCRSAPHNRASSLTTRYWASPAAPPESPAAEESSQEEKVESLEDGGEQDRRSWNGVSVDDEETRPSSVHPLVLMRSKSEPARKAAKLAVPEGPPYWNNAATSNRRRLVALAAQQEPLPPLLRH